MEEDEIIGIVYMRLRRDAVSDAKIKKFLEEKELYGCKTKVALVKKALLYYIDNIGTRNENANSSEKKETTYNSLFG